MGRTVVVVGPSGAGKTLVLRQLLRFASGGQEPPDTRTQPTTGVDLAKLALADGEPQVVVKEVGTCFQQRWDKWVVGADGVLVVLDTSPQAAHEASMVAALDVVGMVAQSPTPVLVVLNKSDLSSRRELSKTYGLLEVDSLTARPDVNAVEASALTGHNMPLVLQWIAELGSRT